MMANLPYVTAVILVLIGLYVILVKKNLIKIAMGITLMEAGANLFLITLAYRNGERVSAPIFTSWIPGSVPPTYSLPTPHALTLTSIVIGVATTALLVAFISRVYKHYKTTNVDELTRLHG